MESSYGSKVHISIQQEKKVFAAHVHTVASTTVDVTHWKLGVGYRENPREVGDWVNSEV